MSPIEIAMQLQRKHIIIGAGIVFCGLWLCLVAYFLFGEKTPAPVNPGAVAVRSASPVATPNAPTVSLKAPRSSVAPMLHHSAPVYSFIHVPAAPKASMSIRIHQTSDASVHTIGSGGGSGVIATTGGGSNGGRGIRTSSISYGGSLLALSSSVALAAPGASEATSLASTTEGSGNPNRPDHIRTTTGDPMDPFLDPIGDVAWVLILLLTIGWCVRVRLRKQ